MSRARSRLARRSKVSAGFGKSAIVLSQRDDQFGVILNSGPLNREACAKLAR